MQEESNLLTALDPSKQFALKLHALHPDDRAWLLSQLSTDASERLLPLLTELEALGLRIDNEHLAPIMQSMPFNGVDANAAMLSEQEILLIFKQEPAWILRYFLQITGQNQLRDADDIHRRPIKVHANDAVKNALLQAVMSSRKSKTLIPEMAPAILNSVISHVRRSMQAVMRKLF